MIKLVLLLLCLAASSASTTACIVPLVVFVSLLSMTEQETKVGDHCHLPEGSCAYVPMPFSVDASRMSNHSILCPFVLAVRASVNRHYQSPAPCAHHDRIMNGPIAQLGIHWLQLFAYACQLNDVVLCSWRRRRSTSWFCSFRRPAMPRRYSARLLSTCSSCSWA